MRKIFTVLLFILAGIALFGQVLVLGVEGADGKVWDYNEETKKWDIPTGLWYYKDLVIGDNFPAEVEIRFYSGDDTTRGLDAAIRAGNAPDVYIDYQGRVFKYAKHALDLFPLLDKDILDDFMPSFLEPLVYNGELKALPATTWAQTCVVNVSLLKAVAMGYIAERGSWTISEFLRATRLIKQKFGNDYYGVAMFAQKTGGDYWSLPLWIAMGGEQWRNGEMVADNENGIAAFKFMKTLFNAGYMDPNVTAYDYTEMISSFKRGNVLMIGGGGSFDTFGQAAYDEGIIDEPFEAQLMEIPRKTLEGKSPLPVGPNAVLVFKTTKYPKLAAQLAERCVSTDVQTYRSEVNGRFPSRFSVTPQIITKEYSYFKGMLDRNGAYDLGLAAIAYYEVRHLWPKALQTLFIGASTPEQSVRWYATEARKVIDRLRAED